MALFGGDRPLFGPSGGTAPAPMAPSAPSPTAQVAEQTGAMASSPFLQYLQANAPAAKQTAQALLGDKPEADYGDAWLQAGLAMMSQPGGQSLLQALGNAGQTAMPLVQQEKKRLQQYDDKVNQLASQLGVGAAEFDLKQKDDNPFVEYGGNVYEKKKLNSLMEAGDVPTKEALDQALVIPKKYEAEQTADALARVEQEYDRLSGRPDLTPEQKERLKFLKSKISSLRADIYPQKESKMGFVPVVTSDGRMAMVAADSEQLSGILKQFGSEKEMRKLKEDQQSAADAAAYTSRLMELTDPDTTSVGSMGRVGGLASSAAAWSDFFTKQMKGPAQKQFTSEVQGRPLERLEEMYQDPEARAWLDDGLFERLRDIGQRDARILSNVLGLGYATAKSADEGGRLSDADVALAVSRLGYDLDAWLNEPTRVRGALMETLSNNVGQYRTKLQFTADSPEQAEQLLKNDVFLNKILPEMGLEGGRSGELVYSPKGRGQSGGGQQTQPPPATQQPPPEPPADMPRPTSKAEMDQLPSGTRFVAPDGSIRVKQ